MYDVFLLFSSIFNFIYFFLFPFLSYSQNCELDFSYTNTGSNMIIMITGELWKMIY